MPCALNWVRGVVYNNCVWLFSDYAYPATGQVLNQHVYQYDFATGVWTTHDLATHMFIGGSPLGLIEDQVYLTNIQTESGKAYRITLSDVLCPVPNTGEDQSV